MRCHNLLLKAFLFLFIVAPVLSSCSCGGGSGSSTSHHSINSQQSNSGNPPDASARSLVEGYLYAPKTAMGRVALQQSETSEYEPLSDASISIHCLGETKSDVTDDSGYFKIEGLPTGECTLKAIKSGYSTLDKEFVLPVEEDGAKIGFTIDNKRLGRILLEDNTSHAGSQVTILDSDLVYEVNTDSNGFFVFPSSIQDGIVQVNATNFCDFYLSSSDTFNFSDNSTDHSMFPEITLPVQFKYELYTDKQEYKKSERIIITLKIVYRGNDTVIVNTYDQAPFVYILNETTDETIQIQSGYLSNVPIPFAFNENNNSYLRSKYIYATGTYVPNVGRYTLYASAGIRSDLPGYICAPKYLHLGNAFIHPGVGISVYE